MLQKIKNSLALQIFIAMIIGAVLGITAGEHMLRLGFIGDIWMNCIKMVMVPMILAAVISGIVSQKDIASLGLPVELVGIVAAFYRVFDMGMTTNNCLGDLVGTVIVSRLESRREAKASSKSS